MSELNFNLSRWHLCFCASAAYNEAWMALNFCYKRASFWKGNSLLLLRTRWSW